MVRVGVGVGRQRNEALVAGLFSEVDDVVELAGAVPERTDLCISDHPGAELSAPIPESAPVRASSQLRVALRELIENALVHADREAPSVDVSVATADGETVVRIADDGPGIPALERELLTTRTEESQLAHGRGLWLWLTYLIVRRSGGRIEFADNEPRGSVVTVALPTRS